MKKYLVIGNPIDHTLSPKLHNYWIKENKINAIYEKKLLKKEDLKNIIKDVREEKIQGINVTVPFKKEVISLLDQQTPKAILTQSVNTIFKEGDAVIGDNTDIGGFELSLKHINYETKNKKIFILGAGGVVPSIILALKASGTSKIYLSNRTKEKAEELKKIDKNINIVNWGETVDSDLIINATSLGLKPDDNININIKGFGKNKLFYDVIYNPAETKFLKDAKKNGNNVENGKIMFIYQAKLAFEIWHGVKPTVNEKVLKLLNND